MLLAWLEIAFQCCFIILYQAVWDHKLILLASICFVSGFEWRRFERLKSHTCFVVWLPGRDVQYLLLVKFNHGLKANCSSSCFTAIWLFFYLTLFSHSVIVQSTLLRPFLQDFLNQGCQPLRILVYASVTVCALHVVKCQSLRISFAFTCFLFKVYNTSKAIIINCCWFAMALELTVLKNGFDQKWAIPYSVILTDWLLTDRRSFMVTYWLGRKTWPHTQGCSVVDAP